jgi:hypothetical protein
LEVLRSAEGQMEGEALELVKENDVIVELNHKRKR